MHLMVLKLWHRVLREGTFPIPQKNKILYGTHLQETIEEGVLHVLDVTFPRRNCPLMDEILPPDDWREEHDHRDSPDDAEDYENLPFRPPLVVPGWNGDGTVPVDRYAEHGVDGTQTDGVVEWQPEVAQHLTQHPMLVGQQVDRVKRHRYGADEKVADRQRGDEVVGRLTDRPFQDEGQEDGEVADDRQ